MRDPQTLHKYAFVHGDPINSIDSSGLFSVAASLGGISVGNMLRGINQSSILSAINAVDRVLDFLDTFNFFRELIQAVDGSKFVLDHLTDIKNSIGIQSGSDYAKLRGLTADHISAVARQLVLDAPEILPRIGKEHGALIKQVGIKSGGRSAKARPTLVIGLPSLPGSFTGSRFLTHAGTVGGMRLGFAVSETGRGGSLFSVGFKFSNSNKVHQIFRLDYHGQGVPTPTTGAATHGRAYPLGGLVAGQSRALGDPIRGVGRPVFHYHIPFSSFS